jgi:Phage related hypothetical protein (DUF1799)
MSFLGLTPQDYDAENTVEVWPDNWRAVLFAIELGNGSWNMGPGGPVGFRPETFREARMALRVTAAEWPALLSDVRVIENAALDEIHKD